MDRLIVTRKLDSLHRCLLRVQAKTPADASALASDPDLQDIVVLNLSRAMQLCVDLAAHALADLQQPPPESMGDAFDRLAKVGQLDSALALRLRKAVGFRNIAVHSYSNIDWAIAHAIATQHLDDFSAFARAMDQRTG